MSETLKAANQEALATIERLQALCKEDEVSPLSPVYLDRANAVILTSAVKGGLGVGFTGGVGIALVRLPRILDEPPRWSAPIFLRLTMAEIGLSFGFQHVQTLMLALGRKMLDALLEGGHSVVGLDSTLVVGSNQSEERGDVIDASMTESKDIISVSQASGLMVKFSVAGGALNVDAGKNKEVYGDGITVQQLASGAVAPLAEMEPLYAQLRGLVAKKADN